MLCWPIGGNPWKDTKIKPPNLNLGAGCNKGQSPKGCWKSRADAVVGFPLPSLLALFFSEPRFPGVADCFVIVFMDGSNR